jgi:uncharacterized damage-inducible protein DinB
MPVSLFGDLFAYNRWANRKVFAQAKQLPADALDRRADLGPGSLRDTLFHIWGAESLWLERWKGNSPSVFPGMPGISLEDLEQRFEETDRARQEFLASPLGDLDRVVSYRNLRGEPFANRLGDLLLHVVNHGVHHRAQILQFLRLGGIPTKGGLDYLFYCFAYPSIALPKETIAAIRGFHMDADLAPAENRVLDRTVIQHYCDYHEWAMARLRQFCDGLSDAELDRPFSMGMGTLRKTLFHIYDAEVWWRSNRGGQIGPFIKLPENTTLAEFDSHWETVRADREAITHNHSNEDLERPVESHLGFGVMRARLGETLIHLCVHGTHHRAQAINMLRQLGKKLPPFDLVEWVREIKST